MQTSASSQTIAVPGGSVRAWKTGLGRGTPLIVIHGGPGFPHDYLENLEELGNDRTIVFWDQLGCGQSDRPDDPSLWRLPRFIEELELVRAAVVGSAQRVSLLGHSWGSMLALDYALANPNRVATLVLDSPVMSAARFSEDVEKLFDALPVETKKVLRAHEAAGTTDSQEYGEAYGEFIGTHLCRLDPFPEAGMRSLQGKGDAVYSAMWGPSEFTFIGNLSSYERIDRLPTLGKPVLYVTGEHDEVVPAAAAAYRDATPGAELVLIEDASHLKNLEQPKPYLAAVRDFLRRHDSIA
jgi:proline-specific peptidase